MSEDKCDVIIAQVGPTFGRKGEVKVRPFTDNLDDFGRLGEVCITNGPPHIHSLKIERAWQHKGQLIIKFAGIDDMDTAESLRNAEIRVNASELTPLGEDEYYMDDLLGMEVVTSEGESLGKIKEILQSPANDVYVTDRAMIPAVKEIVLRIDLNKKKMVVKAMEGLVQE